MSQFEFWALIIVGVVGNSIIMLIQRICQHRKTTNRVKRIIEREFAMETDPHTVATISRIWRRVHSLTFADVEDSKENP